MTSIDDMVVNIQKRLGKPVVLIGMMGVGKSSIGVHLAQKLDLPFHDTDKIIEGKAGRSVSEIFDTFGEKKFRQSERITINELLEEGASVIATGGGAITNPEVLKMILERSLCVWLKADISSITERASKSDNRPLLKGNEDVEKTLSDLLEKRFQYYSQAHIHFDTSDKAIEITAAELIEKIYQHL